MLAMDQEGEIITHALYDEWGKPLTEARLGGNFAGIDNINNYTGYTYDYLLDIYFAQNRFYNPDTRQFITQDKVKDGMNWYGYCEGNPLVNVDWLGKWAAPYTDDDGVYHGDPDYEEFHGTIAYQALSDLTESYKLAKTDSQRSDIAALAAEVRRIAKYFGNELNSMDKDILPKGEKCPTDYNLNSVERILKIYYTLGAYWALATGSEATSRTERIFGSRWGVGGRSDAFRHGFWAAYLTWRTDKKFAKFWLDAHEYGTPANMSDILVPDHGGTRYDEVVMDLYNNSMGIQSVKEAHKNRDKTFEDNAEEYILEQINSGKFKTIIYERAKGNI